MHLVPGDRIRKEQVKDVEVKPTVEGEVKPKPEGEEAEGDVKEEEEDEDVIVDEDEDEVPFKEEIGWREVAGFIVM